MQIKKVVFKAKAEAQPEFVLANVSVSTEDGMLLRGIKVLKSKFENSGPYLEYPGFTGQDQKRIPFFFLPQESVDEILDNYETWEKEQAPVATKTAKATASRSKKKEETVA